MRTAIFLLIVFCVSTIFAGTTGKITGTVTDNDTGEAIPGANIMIVGTHLGSATDLKGNYTIINVPLGTYTVEASIIGYRTVKTKDVKVKANSTTKLNFVLSAQSIESEAIVVTAERPMIMKDISSQMATVSGAKMRSAEMYIQHNTEEYDKIDESGFYQVIQKPMSTLQRMLMLHLIPMPVALSCKIKCHIKMLYAARNLLIILLMITNNLSKDGLFQ